MCVCVYKGVDSVCACVLCIKGGIVYVCGFNNGCGSRCGRGCRYKGGANVCGCVFVGLGRCLCASV